MPPELLQSLPPSLIELISKLQSMKSQFPTQLDPIQQMSSADILGPATDFPMPPNESSLIRNQPVFRPGTRPTLSARPPTTPLARGPLPTPVPPPSAASASPPPWDTGVMRGRQFSRALTELPVPEMSMSGPGPGMSQAPIPSLAPQSMRGLPVGGAAPTSSAIPLPGRIPGSWGPNPPGGTRPGLSAPMHPGVRPTVPPEVGPTGMMFPPSQGPGASGAPTAGPPGAGAGLMSKIGGFARGLIPAAAQMGMQYGVNQMSPGPAQSGAQSVLNSADLGPIGLFGIPSAIAQGAGTISDLVSALRGPSASAATSAPSPRAISGPKAIAGTPEPEMLTPYASEDLPSSSQGAKRSKRSLGSQAPGSVKIKRRVTPKGLYDKTISDWPPIQTNIDRSTASALIDAPSMFRPPPLPESLSPFGRSR